MVWDNSSTAYAKKIVKDHYGFDYDGVPDNSSLSKVYNRVINRYFSHDLLMIFDQDSKINESYFDEVELNWRSNIEKRALVFVPQVNSGNKLISPGRKFIVKGRPQKKWTAGFYIAKNLLAIMSGIVISKQCIDMLINKYGSVFDERLNLYGIDSKFFVDYGETGFDVYVMNSSLQHDSALRANGGMKVERLENLISAWMIVYSSGVIKKLLVRIYGFYFVVKQAAKYRRPVYLRAIRALMRRPPSGRGLN
jgi:hypothetical protein